jgi:hypothetical protein
LGYAEFFNSPINFFWSSQYKKTNKNKNGI